MPRGSASQSLHPHVQGHGLGSPVRGGTRFSFRVAGGIAMTDKCARCWRALPEAKGRGRPRLYCGVRCRRLAEYDRARIARAARSRAWWQALLGNTERKDENDDRPA